MTAHELEALNLSKINNSSTPDNENKDDEYSIPLDISDIINICREYNKLGWQVQSQVESILDIGVEESIKNGVIHNASLSLIKSFLSKICDNPYFGDAGSQANDCIKLIQQYEEIHKIKSVSNIN